MDTPKKTYKREVAFLLLVWLGYLTETKDIAVVETLAFPIFTFAALAYGLEWYAPNGRVFGGKSSRTSDGK